MNLELATFLTQMAAGGLAFLWVTSRRRLVSLGYGWLLRGVFGVLAVASIILETHADHAGNGQVVFLFGTAGMVIGASVATLVSVLRRSAGVARKRELQARRVARVAAMVGGGDAKSNGSDVGREFPPSLDLIAPVFGVFALLGAATFTGEHWWLSAVRLLVGAAFLGAILDAMLLGHWYLTQPGLSREPLRELVRVSAIIWPLEIVVLIIPLGMMSVLLGTIDDGYNGLLGWMWAVCALGTIALLGATWLALRERAYSAVMAATGLLYLAILTAFGTDLLARALLTR